MMKNLLLAMLSIGSVFAIPAITPAEEWTASTQILESPPIINKNRMVAKSKIQLGVGASLIYFIIPLPSLSLRYRAPIFQNPAHSSNGYANRFSVFPLGCTYESLIYKTPTSDSSSYKGYGLSLNPEIIGGIWSTGSEYGLQKSDSSYYSEYHISLYTFIPNKNPLYFPNPIISIGYEIGYCF